MNRTIKISETYHVKLRKDASRYYTVQCVELPAAISQGKTETEALRNIKEAIALVVEDLAAAYRDQRQKIRRQKSAKLKRLVTETVHLTPELHAALTNTARENRTGTSQEIEKRLRENAAIKKRIAEVRAEPDVGLLAANPKKIGVKEGGR